LQLQFFQLTKWNQMDPNIVCPQLIYTYKAFFHFGLISSNYKGHVKKKESVKLRRTTKMTSE